MANQAINTVQIDDITITIVDDFVIAFIDHNTYACELHSNMFSRCDGRSLLPCDIVAVCKEAIINKKISYNYMINNILEVRFECSVGSVEFIIGDCRDVINAFIALKKYLAN